MVIAPSRNSKRIIAFGLTFFVSIALAVIILLNEIGGTQGPVACAGVATASVVLILLNGSGATARKLMIVCLLLGPSYFALGLRAGADWSRWLIIGSNSGFFLGMLFQFLLLSWWIRKFENSGITQRTRLRPSRRVFGSYLIHACGALAMVWAFHFMIYWCSAKLDAEYHATFPMYLDLWRQLTPDGPHKLVLFSSGIAAGIVEEYSFRKVLQGSLTRVVGSTLGVILASQLFAIAHLPQSLDLAIFQILVGGVLGVLYLKTGDVKLCMLVHAVWNAKDILLYRMV